MAPLRSFEVSQCIDVSIDLDRSGATGTGGQSAWAVLLSRSLVTHRRWSWVDQCLGEAIDSKMNGLCSFSRGQDSKHWKLRRQADGRKIELQCPPATVSAFSPWANLQKASGSWLPFQIERAKVWSPRWVENDKRKGFGGVVENCGVQTLSKNRFFWSVRQGRRRGMRLAPWVSISSRFTADIFVICRRCRGTAYL